MTIKNFIPTIWSARLNNALEKKMVFGNLVNHDYEGEISGQGSSVKINTIGDVTIGDYTGANIGTPEELDSTQATLTINQAKFFNFAVDDIDKAQANVDVLDAGVRNAAYGLADVMDKYIVGLYTETDKDNLIGDDTTPIAVTKDNAYDNLIDLGVKLDESNVPEEGRFVVVPASYHGLLLKDARFTKDPEVLASGYIGEIDGMKVYKSNNTPVTDGKYKVIAGYTGAIAFAQQLDSIENYRPEGGFKDAVKGLQLYGAKVIQPKGIAVLTCTIK